MPSKPPRSCNQHGCGILTNDSYCHEHKRQAQQKQDKERGTAHQRGYGSRWRKARATYLSHRPLCVMCEQEGKIVQAIVVDHKVPHKGDQDLFWDKNNWQPLCKRHHDIKTAKEDGGFGRVMGKGG